MSTGIEGLDEILQGGLSPGRMYLVHGGPGTGKTTLALQFLLEGIRCGEKCLYIGIGGSGEELSAAARAHGWTIEVPSFHVHEITLMGDSLETPKLRVFHRSDLEFGQTIHGILSAVHRISPQRVVVDSLSELRLLAEDQLRLRREIIALKQSLLSADRTILLIDYPPVTPDDVQLEALAHGTVLLERLSQDYGPTRRRLQISKFRAKAFRSGWHDFAIKTGGVEVYPMLATGHHARKYRPDMVSSGKPELDSLLGGGLNKGSSTALIGAAGIGKSTLATQFLLAAAERGENATLYSFDESTESFLERAEGMGLDVASHIEQGLLKVRQLDVAEVSPGEFVTALKSEVEERNVTIIVIDSLNGYLNAMPDEKYLVLQLHELLTYLGQRGVCTIITVAQHGLIGSAMHQQLDISYLADSVMLLRFFEFGGEVRRAVSILKKRRGHHELTIRELTFSGNGISISPPLRNMHGVLTGMPSVITADDAAV
ncbi:MAG TPA: ATPase domain-containing protein [Verrucomicrobiae bacterium]|nr:ATPase domain-containing protein [Verrucomicrobiae bacterium]